MVADLALEKGTVVDGEVSADAGLGGHVADHGRAERDVGAIANVDAVSDCRAGSNPDVTPDAYIAVDRDTVPDDRAGSHLDIVRNEAQVADAHVGADNRRLAEETAGNDAVRH